MKLNKWYLGLMNYLAPSIISGQSNLFSSVGYNPNLNLQNMGMSQADIDAAIQKQIDAQNTALTNNIVKQSVNVPYRNPASYFYGGNAPGMMAEGGNNLYLKQNIASPQLQALQAMKPLLGNKRQLANIKTQNAAIAKKNAPLEAANAIKNQEYQAQVARNSQTFDNSMSGGANAYNDYIKNLMSQFNLLG